MLNDKSDPRPRHSGVKMEAILVRNSMEKGGIFCWRHGTWILLKKGVFLAVNPNGFVKKGMFFRKVNLHGFKNTKGCD